MRNRIWIIVPLFVLTLSKALSWTSRNSSSTLISSCIHLVAQHHFRSNSTVSVLTAGFYDFASPSLVTSYPADLEDSLIKLLSVSTQFSLVTMKPTDNNSCCFNRLYGNSTADYFIIVGRTDSVVGCIKTFCFGKLTNDRTHFVVYLETEIKGARAIIEDTLKMFWKQQHQNVAILVKSQPEVIDIYTWFPLELSPQVDIVDQCDGRSFRDHKPLFPPKLPQDLYGKVINIGVVVAPIATCERIGGGYAGLEVELLQAMASALNFKVTFHSASAFARENKSEVVIWEGSSGPWQTILYRMVTGDVDISIGGFMLWKKLFDDFDYTQLVMSDAYTIHATTDPILSGETERWIGIMCLQMIIVHAFTTLAMYYLRRKHSGPNGIFGQTAITVWAVLTDVPVQFSNPSSRQQLLWVVAFFYVLNINAAYRSIVTSLLASPIYTERILTVADMIGSDLPFLAANALPEAIIADVFSSDEYAKLRKRVSLCYDPLQTCLANFISVPQYGVAAFSGDMTFLEYALPNKKFHRLDRTIRPSYIVIYTTKNFFLTRKMTTMILRSAQAGLIDVWWRSVLSNKVCDLQSWTELQNADSNEPLSENSSDDMVRPFSTTNLYPAFVVLALGLVIAGLACIFEISSATHTFRDVCTRLKQYPRALRDRRVIRTNVRSLLK